MSSAPSDNRPRYRQYILDDFQVEAFAALDAGNNVLCCAPTGSGKTLLAEYLVERTLASGSGEVIYTAPIKALSNQKFRDFKALYGDEKVGIVTGDVVHNADAPILIMTTEIYRNIMYDNPERLDRVKHVVFDEVHYLEDDKRGTVWEESLMLSPRHVRFLMLSATVANADQIAGWLSDVRGIPTVHISHTERPVPLTLGFFVEGAGFFKKEKLSAAVAAAKGGDTGRERGKPKRRGGINILDWLTAEEKLPALYFCFSRKLCEILAKRYSVYGLNSPEEADEAARYFEEYAKARDLDRFASVQALLQLVSAGVCYHHAGMLPSVKEAIEVLFGRGLIKVLFATETFAVGINMPARTVVFSSLEKNDGVSFRFLRRYEFAQMSGRAGRRGIDEVGHVVVSLEPKYARLAETRETCFGELEPLRSRFGFSYSSLLNLYGRHSVDEIKELARLSLAGRQMDGLRETVERDIARLEEEMAELACVRGKGKARTQIEEFQALDARLDAARAELDDTRRSLRAGEAGPRAEAEGRLHDLADEIADLRKRLGKNRCRKCFSGSRCKTVMERLALRRRQKGALRYEMVTSVDRKFDLLGRLGYVDAKARLPRGDFASDIFGYELQCTELLFDGYFTRLTPREICALVSTITFEARHDRTSRVRVRQMRAPVSDFVGLIEGIRELEAKVVGDSILPPPDPGFVDIAWDWAGGMTFEGLLSREPDWTEGDLIRQLRQNVDLLRQVKRAVRRDALMTEKIGKCLELVNRDVVDAEKYL